MKRAKLALAAAAVLAAAGAATGHPLRLDYCVEDIGGGVFRYSFFYTLDNNDNSWAPGQGWRWFIFGDANQAASPLTNFVGDPASLPVGPWTGYSSSGGGHNGPTFSSVLDYWIPTAVGETLRWQGTSTADLAQGQLLYSNIAGTLGGAIAPNFAVANRLATCGGPPACYPDCDLSHSLNVNDFVCFQGAFAAGNLALADCNGDTSLNVNDFVCFQSAFAAGCSAP